MPPDKEHEPRWKIIDKLYNKVDKTQLIDLLSDELKRDNINFNYTTFKDACND